MTMQEGRTERTARRLLWGACVGLLAGWAGAGEPLPSIEDLVKSEKTEEGRAETAEEQKPRFPKKLSVEEANLQASELLPENPYLYLEAANGGRTGRAWDESALSQLLDHKRVQQFLKNNSFTLSNLFTDLPERYSDSESLNLYEAAAHFVRGFLRVDARVMLAAYAGGEKGLQIVFLADIGRDRKAPFEKLETMAEEFLEAHPAFVLEESPRGDDYIDVMHGDAGQSHLAFGIVRNYVVISTSAPIARNLIRLGKGNGEGKTLGQAAVYRELAQRTESDAHVRGFADLRALLREVQANQLPGATEMLNLACDVAGRGVLFYDLRVDRQQIIEHIVSPAQVNTEANELPGIPARLLRVCAPPAAETTWTTNKVVPYQPDLYMAARVQPAAIVDLLASSRALGGSAYAKQIAISIPPALKSETGPIQRLKSNFGVLDGEVALALLPAMEDRQPWLCVLALKDADAAEGLLQTEKPATVMGGGLRVFSSDSSRWEKSPCWTVLRQGKFQSLQASQLVITSSGELLQTIVDQATAVAASLAENREFQAQIKAVGEGQSLIWYYNLPAKVSREYVDLPNHVRTYFPNLQNVSNRPPLSVISKHIFGIAGGVVPKPGDIACHSTVVSPCAVGPSLAGLLLINLPRWIRERARIYHRNSRENLGRIWLILQNYATQRGHYPESMEELQGLFPRGDEQRRTFISLAAVEQIGLTEAARNSYSYVLGVRPTDEPNRPILYESGPWHYEYRGIMRPKGGHPTETGPYTQWRLVLQLDGTIRAYTEDEFQRRILPRIKARD